MTAEEIKKELYENVLNGDFDLTQEIAQKVLSENMDPLEAINTALIPA